MKASKRIAGGHNPLPNVMAAKQLFQTGRWATQQLKAAALSGAVSAQVLRTGDTLRHEEWKFFDDAVIAEAVIRLVGVADLISNGQVINVPNALGKTVFGYERVTDMDPAQTSLDGLAQTANDVQEFDLNQLPLPITHKDFFIDLRKLSASREKGEALDTTQVRTAGRVVAEQLESMLFKGGPTFGSLPIYGYETHPNLNSVSFDGGKNWGDTTKAGSSYLKDLLAAISALQGDRMFGPYVVYVPTNASVVLDNDYNAGTANIQSIRQRLSQVSGVKAIRVADQMTTNKVIVVQATQDVAAWVSGESLQTVQWDEAGGFKINFKAFAIGVPLIRADIQGRSGVAVIS
jgi:uncharacterized linocin/CFP29 family protein